VPLSKTGFVAVGVEVTGAAGRHAVDVEDVELMSAGAAERGGEGVWFLSDRWLGGSGGLPCARGGGGRD